MKEILGVLYKVPSGEPVGIPMRHIAAFGVSRDSGKTTFEEAVTNASGLKAIVFRTKRGELGFENAKPLPLFFDERGLTHWKSLEGLIAATLEEKVQREPGVRGAIINVCKNPTLATSLTEIHERVKSKLKDPKLRGFERDVFTKLDAYLEEVLPQLNKLRGRFTDRLELPEPGLYVEDLIGLSDELQNLFVASLMRKVYEEFSGVIVVVAEVWKFLPQDRGSPVKWIIEKYVREMGVVNSWLYLDAQDLRGVDKKHLRSFDIRLFGRQPDAHEIEEILKALPLPKNQKPAPEKIMMLKLGHFYAKLRDNVELVYVRPVWLPEEVAVRVAKGELLPDSDEVQKYKPSQSQENDEMYKEQFEEEKRKREECEKEFARQLERLTEKARQEASAEALKKVDEIKKEWHVDEYQRTIAELKDGKATLETALKQLEPLKAFGAAFQNFLLEMGVMTPTTSAPVTVQAGPSMSIADVDERINQRLSQGPEPIPLVSVDVDQRIKDLVKNEVVSRIVQKIQALPGPAKKAAWWLHEKKQVNVRSLYNYVFDKAEETGRVPGTFYMNIVNPLVDAWLIVNDGGNIHWCLQEKLQAELKNVLSNSDIEKVPKYLASLLL